MVVHTLLLDDDALIKILSNPFVLDNNISDFTSYFFHQREKNWVIKDGCVLPLIRKQRLRDCKLLLTDFLLFIIPGMSYPISQCGRGRTCSFSAPPS